MALERKDYFLCILKNSNKSTYGKRKGSAGVLYAKYRASMDGYIVSSEESDAFDFDFTLFNSGKHYGVQAKSTAYCRYKNNSGSTYTPVKRVRRFSNGQWKDVIMSYQHVDIFAFIDLRYELIAWIPFNQITSTKFNIKYGEYKHWTLSKIVGEPDTDLHVDEHLYGEEFIDEDEYTLIFNQQELFNYTGEKNGN